MGGAKVSFLALMLCGSDSLLLLVLCPRCIVANGIGERAWRREDEVGQVHCYILEGGDAEIGANLVEYAE
jgi:hypothetical protein